MALYWAEELAASDKAWEPLAKALRDNEEKIMKDLIECQVLGFWYVGCGDNYAKLGSSAFLCNQIHFVELSEFNESSKFFLMDSNIIIITP